MGVWVRALVSAFFKYCVPWNLVATFMGWVCRWPHAGEDARGGKVRSIKRELSPPAPLSPPATPRQMGLHSNSDVALSYMPLQAHVAILAIQTILDLYCTVLYCTVLHCTVLTWWPGAVNEVIKVDVLHKVTALQLGGAGQPEPQHAPPHRRESSHLKKWEHMKVLRGLLWL